MGLPGREKCLDTFSDMDTIHECDGRTDGHRLTAITLIGHHFHRGRGHIVAASRLQLVFFSGVKFLLDVLYEK